MLAMHNHGTTLADLQMNNVYGSRALVDTQTHAAYIFPALQDRLLTLMLHTRVLCVLYELNEHASVYTIKRIPIYICKLLPLMVTIA